MQTGIQFAWHVITSFPEKIKKIIHLSSAKAERVVKVNDVGYMCEKIAKPLSSKHFIFVKRAVKILQQTTNCKNQMLAIDFNLFNVVRKTATDDHAICKRSLYAKETISMKCQRFSGENKKKYLKMLSVENFTRHSKQ